MCVRGWERRKNSKCYHCNYSSLNIKRHKERFLFEKITDSLGKTLLITHINLQFAQPELWVTSHLPSSGSPWSQSVSLNSCLPNDPSVNSGFVREERSRELWIQVAMSLSHRLQVIQFNQKNCNMWITKLCWRTPWAIIISQSYLKTIHIASINKGLWKNHTGR